MAQKHKCNYCECTETGTRSKLIDIGWSFVDITAPFIKHIKCCPDHFDELKDDIVKATDGIMSLKWD